MGREWTREEEDFMVKEYPERSYAEIGKILDRTRAAVKNKHQSLRYAGTLRPVQQEHDMKQTMAIRPLYANEEIPPMPGLLDHLMSMAGSMDSQIVMPNANHRNRVARLETLKPKIVEMLGKKMKYADIAKEIGMNYYTVFEYVKTIRAAA
jgi:hypothetical protein